MRGPRGQLPAMHSLSLARAKTSGGGCGRSGWCYDDGCERDNSFGVECQHSGATRLYDGGGGVKTMGGCLSRVAGLGLVAILGAGGYHYIRIHRLDSIRNALFSRRAPLSLTVSRHDGAEYFSPSENLERLELAELEAAAERARNSGTPLRIAVYSFTDHSLAQVLVAAADRGAVVELYRDGEQYEMEEQNGQRFHDGSVTSLFRGHQNIHVRVKPASRSDLMHLKSWTDGTVLREGSANWSPAGLRRQDNNVRFTDSPDEIKAFVTDFETMWNRPGNLVIQ